MLTGILPGRHADPRVTELKPWARVALSVWVLSTFAAFTALAALIALNASAYIDRGWQALAAQLQLLAAGARNANALNTLLAAIGTLMLLLPLTGLTLTYLLICRRTGRRLALRRARRHAGGGLGGDGLGALCRALRASAGAQPAAPASGPRPEGHRRRPGAVRRQ